MAARSEVVENEAAEASDNGEEQQTALAVGASGVTFARPGHGRFTLSRPPVAVSMDVLFARRPQTVL